MNELRQLFAIITASCRPSNRRSLYEQFREAVAEYTLLQARRNLHDDALGFSDAIFNELLQLLDDAASVRRAAGVCKELQRELSYDKCALATYVAPNSLCWCQIQRSHTTTRRAGTKNKLEGQTRRRRHGGEEYGKRVSPSHPTRGSGERHELPHRIWCILTTAAGGKDSRNFVVYAIL